MVLNLPQVSQLSVPGNSNVEQAYLQYPTDVEYFQLITGLTVSNFLTLQNTTATSAYFPSGYLSYDIRYLRPDCPISSPFAVEAINNVITKVNNYQGLEVCIFVRGVDAFTQKQTVKYDLSKIFGYTSLSNSVTIEGSYYINQPIQGYSYSSGLTTTRFPCNC